MNWGVKLVLGLGLFMTFVIVLVTKAIMSNQDDLVTKDYYELGQHYDTEYIEKNNVIQDAAAPDFVAHGDTLSVRFKEPTEGKVVFTHPSTSSEDRLQRFRTDDRGLAFISVAGLAKVNWRLRFEWKSNGKSYVFEKEWLNKP